MRKTLLNDKIKAEEFIDLNTLCFPVQNIQIYALSLKAFFL